MTKGKRSFVLIVALGMLTFLALAAFLYQLQDTRPVLVATHQLAPGTRLDDTLVEVRQLPAAAVLPGAVQSAAEVRNQTITLARAVGDQITADMVGSRALSALAAGLAPGERAVAVHVDRATGLAGMLQAGDRVSVVGIIDPQALPPAGADKPTSTAMVVVTGARVLLVPQLFRYQETAPSQSRGGLVAVSTNTQEQNKSVVLLALPVAPQPLYPGGPAASPVETLALLNDKGAIHLALDPLQADYTAPPAAVQLGDLLDAMRKAQAPAGK